MVSQLTALQYYTTVVSVQGPVSQELKPRSPVPAGYSNTWLNGNA